MLKGKNISINVLIFIMIWIGYAASDTVYFLDFIYQKGILLLIILNSIWLYVNIFVNKES